MRVELWNLYFFFSAIAKAALVTGLGPAVLGVVIYEAFFAKAANRLGILRQVRLPFLSSSNQVASRLADCDDDSAVHAEERMKCALPENLSQEKAA